MMRTHNRIMGFSNDTPVQAIYIGDRSSRITDPAVKFRPLMMDTDGNAHPSLAAEYALCVEERVIDEQKREYLSFRFRAALPVDASPDTECGKFTAKLWQRDCSEFFLCNPASGRYLEFNLNPNGAWWSASFDGPRVHRSDEPFMHVLCFTKTDKNDDPAGAGVSTWTATISIPLNEIETVLETSIVNLTANVTAILSTPNQIFLTAAPLGCDEPDFHRPTDWLPVRVAGRPS